jgi:hypothetical protein
VASRTAERRTLRPRRTTAEAVARRVDNAGTEIADAERISKSYVSRILRLALLASDLVEAILRGWAYQRLMLQKLERLLPTGWEEQRAALREGNRTTARAAGRGPRIFWRSDVDWLPVSAGCARAVERFVRRRTSRSLPG